MTVPTSSRFGSTVPNVYGAYGRPEGDKRAVKRATLSVTTSGSTGLAAIVFPATKIYDAFATSTDSPSTAPFHVATITSISSGTVNIITLSLGSTSNAALVSGAATVVADFY